MKYSAFLLALVTSVAAALSASAQSSDWTGFYAGGEFNTLNNGTTFPLTDLLTEGEIVSQGLDLGDGFKVDLDGNSYGAHLGYMYDAGRYVLGAEIAWNKLNFDEISGSFQGETFTEGFDTNTNDTIIHMKIRAGYDAGKFLPYLSVGAARLEITDQSDDGSFYGVGMAFLAADNFLIGGEILKHQFNDFGGRGYDFEATTMSVRASYKF
jgi:outer membrane immunogenic protein